MLIPGIDEPPNAPPPLPPPRYISGNDQTHLPPNMRDERHFGPGSTASFASGYSIMASSFAEERPRDGFNGDRNEGYSSYSTDEYESPCSGQLGWSKPANKFGVHRFCESLRTEFGLHHNRFQFQSPTHIHGDSMKKKLDPVRMLDKSLSRPLSASVNELLPQRPSAVGRFPPALSVPAQFSIRPRDVRGSPIRFTTTAHSFGQRLPGLSLGGISPTSECSPRATPVSLNPSPRNSISGQSAVHASTVSGASSRDIGGIPKSGCPKLQEVFLCDCCPKRPRQFDAAEKLNTHKAKKPYNCSFCRNYFKNKNEAERHVNSLHVRNHSWSCSVLSRYDRVFHDSTNRPGEADTCGYCGVEFPRSGGGPGASVPRHTSEQDWDQRIQHLQETHKFRECNSSKKFYRADHFRQHLKHSHAGTSGKWTNMLENACMLEENPTPR